MHLVSILGLCALALGATDPAGSAGAPAITRAPAARSAAAGPQWPATPLGGHARAWFAQQTGSEDEARAFLREHFAAAALAQAPIEERLGRRRALRARAGVIVPLEVLEASASAMRVRGRNEQGESVIVSIEGEAAPPHRLLGLRIEVDSDDDEGPAARGPALSDPEALEQIAAALDARAREDAFSGVVLVARDGKPLLTRAWGLADRDRRVPLTAATRFNLASIGKIFTRVALAQLAEQGKLDLDDRLAEYLPDFPNADSITLEMLAEHRSGVGDIFNARYQAMDKALLRHNRDYLQLIRDQPLWFRPGTSKRYSNGGYVLLGEVIAKASGEDYDDYLKRHVFGPAGMAETAALLEGDGTAGVARGYTREGKEQGAWRDNQGTRPARGSAAGGSYSTAADLLAFDQALAHGTLLNPAWTAWVTAGVRPTPGAAVAAGAGGGFAFAGGAPGISTQWMHEGDRTLILLTNLDPETISVGSAKVRELFQRMTSAPSPP